MPNFINTDRLWRALGTFYTNYFPEEERVYWDAYWSAYAELNADLWGYAYQVDQSRSVFLSKATVERLNVMLDLTLESKVPFLDFELAAVSEQAGITTVRGYVPRNRLKSKVADIPQRGLVRIGRESIPYTTVNAVGVVSGPLAGYTSEATFTLERKPSTDYQDTIDINESFPVSEHIMSFRINQVPGQNFVDATSDGRDLHVEPTGRLIIGTPGVNYEVIEYQSVTKIADRYVFQMPATWKDPGFGSAPTLNFPHAIGDQIKVSVVSPDERFDVSTDGPCRVYGAGAAVVSIDNEPAPAASSARLVDSVSLQSNTDFDVEVTVLLSDWRTPTVNSTERDAGVRVAIGTQVIDLVYRTSRSGLGAVIEMVRADVGLPRLLSSRPTRVTLRVVRSGSALEFYAKTNSDADYVLVAKTTTNGDTAKLTLVGDDNGTGVPSVYAFDEIVRRQGTAVGSTRPVSAFQISELFPYRYDVDLPVTFANKLQEQAGLLSQPMTIHSIVIGAGGDVIRCQAAAGFAAGGLPPGGIIRSGDATQVYDGVSRVQNFFDFAVRGGVADATLFPPGATITAETRIIGVDEFSFDGEGKLFLRDLPTQSRLWAPLAQVDEQLVQRQHGPLVDMTAIVSTESYVRRVQGAWYALMSGPAIENVRIGVHLALGLPAAKIAGVVTSISERRDTVGRVIERSLIISGPDGTVKHTMDPGLPDIWSVAVGQQVDVFEPLTLGVEVLDVDVDPAWGTRFGGLAPDDVSLERWNSFGILADVSALGDDASLYDAVKFALKIKPVWSKMFFSFSLGNLGREEIIVDDDSFFTVVSQHVEDVSFDEGSAPLPPQEPLRLGDGHKLGQGKFLGGNSVFRVFPRLGAGLNLGTGLTLGMDPRAWVGDPDGDGHAREVLTVTPVIEVLV